MGKLIFLPAIALLTAAAPQMSVASSLATEIAPSNAEQPIGLSGGSGKSVKAPDDKKICRKLETTGSRLPRQACLTAREWEQVQSELDR